MLLFGLALSFVFHMNNNKCLYKTGKCRAPRFQKSAYELHALCEYHYLRMINQDSSYLHKRKSLDGVMEVSVSKRMPSTASFDPFEHHSVRAVWNAEELYILSALLSN